MKFIADLHIHSPYSRAVSPQMDIPNLDIWGSKKGIQILGTGDFTHPKWIKHLYENLEEAEPGLYKQKNTESSVRFMVTAEISSIYSHGGQVRRVHNLIFSPSLEIAEKINNELRKRGAKIESDGRPITGISSRELLNLALEVSDKCLFVPAHIWTPWFAVFGSKSGYDSLEECFGEDAKYIYAVETGLSSDPEMNWRVSELHGRTLISNSDAHSLHRLGREANVLEIEPDKLSYDKIISIIKEGNPKSFLHTIEYYPEEGRYHYDGDRKHKISLHPKESAKTEQKCPECGKKLTIGVLSRVQDLADHPEGHRPETAIPGIHLVPLAEIIAECEGVKSVNTKTVTTIYNNMVENYKGGELGILLDADFDEIANLASEKIAEGVRRVREGELNIVPGYDGEYGIVEIFTTSEKQIIKNPQVTLF